MCILPSIFAGVLRRGFYYITVFRSIILDKKISGVFSHKVLNKKSDCSEVLMIHFMLPFPSYGSESRGYREGAGAENYGG